MKKITLIIFILATYCLAQAQDMKGMDMEKKAPSTLEKAGGKAKPATYTCPMHPEIHADKPGNCPKCGMKLVKEKPKASIKNATEKMDEMPMSAATYTCPMHPEIHADKPGNCPKCGMKLVKEKPKASIKNATEKMDEMPVSVATYTCPMHPEIHSDKPGNCPKCGMKLVKEKAKASPENDMNGMDMGAAKEQADMADDMHMDNGLMQNIKSAKAKLGPVKTISNTVAPRTVRYDLYVKDTIVTFGKKAKRAIAVNGQIPMPTLTFTEGDSAEIWVHNELDETTTLHWHGLMLPSQYDGVPNLTQMPIEPHTTHLYKFKIIQHGTHWYHSHSGLQEQVGMYGMFIMNKREEWNIPTENIIVSEWTDMKPKEVNRSLRAATDWFAIQKGSTQSYSEAIAQGHFKTKISNEWKRMNSMDLTDIYYDNILVNGQNQISVNIPSGGREAGNKVRLRIANAGASDYFWLKYAGGKITVVASDGNDVEPVEVDRLIIAVSETYDVVVTVPENKSYEFLVTPEDRTKYASIWIGSGEKVAAEKMKRPKYFAGMKMMNEMMDMKGNMVEMEGMKMENQVMDMNTVMYPEASADLSKGGEQKPNEHDMSKMNMAPSASEKAGGEVSKEMQTNNHPHSMQAMKMAPSPLERAVGEVNSMQGMNMASETPDMVTLNYAMLRNTEKSTLPQAPFKEMKFDLTGNMNRYVWSMDNKVVSERDKIMIKKGENVRIILYNNSMMRHPMHLHGHDFRLLNGQGEYAPMKNIIDIMPMERDTLEFTANAYGDWFFHCHILYHMMSGMGAVFSYENQPANPEIPNAKLAQKKLFADDKMLHPMGRIAVESNGSDGEFMLAQTRWKASTLWHLGYHDEHGYESETMIGRYLGRMQWWYPYIGFDYHYKVEGSPAKNIFAFKHSPKNIFGSEEKNLFGQISNKNNRHTAVAGIAYTLPTLTGADFRVDGEGKFRFQLSREDLAVTPRLRFSWMLNTDKEYMAGLRYIVTKYISVSSHYDSDMGLGAGIAITY